MYKNIKIFICLFVFFSHLLSAKELQHVTLQPSWFEQFQFAGYYIAKEKGFYNDVGLEVEIKPFKIKSKATAVQQVNDGLIDFAIDREALVLEKANNKKIVLLYALFQASPLVLLSTKESQINTFRDFFGKKIMASFGDTEQVSLKAMLNANNVELSDLNILPHSNYIQDLLNKNTDIISAYISKFPYDLERMGVEYNVFSPQDYGFDLYSDFLFTSENFIANNAEATKAFREASLKGWEYAFANIDEAIDVILEKYNEQKLTREALFFEGTELKKLAYLNTPVIGVIEESKLKKSFDLYKVLGVEKGEIDLTQFIYDNKNSHIFYTDQEKSYLEQKKKITYCIDPNWLPYEGFDDEGMHIGLNTEFYDIFRKQLSIPLEVVKTNSWTQSVEFAKQRKCDLLSFAGVTPERERFLNFTSPYLIFPHVLVTKPELPFVNDLRLLGNKKIGMVKGYAQQEYIKTTYPNIIIVDVDNVQSGLQKVADGKLYGFIDGLNTVEYFLNEEFLGELKVSGKFDKKRELGIGVRNDEPLLLQVFNKLVNNLSKETIAGITDKSTSIKYIAKFNYELLWWFVFALVLIVCAFLYRQSVLKNLNKRLNEKVSEKTKALRELNESLEIKIKERTEKVERSKKLLQSVAYRDSLTGIFNRHYLFEQSNSLFESSSQLNEPLSMLIIDIDHFKKVNDNYGHIIGDNILKHCVNHIQKKLRADDLFARYGGEEFIVLLPKVKVEESLIVANKLLIYIEEAPYRSDEVEKPISVTISIGISQYQEGDTLEKLIDRADSALYVAKENGRNQARVKKK